MRPTPHGTGRCCAACRRRVPSRVALRFGYCPRCWAGVTPKFAVPRFSRRPAGRTRGSLHPEPGDRRSSGSSTYPHGRGFNRHAGSHALAPRASPESGDPADVPRSGSMATPGR